LSTSLVSWGAVPVNPAASSRVMVSRSLGLKVSATPLKLAISVLSGTGTLVRSLAITAPSLRYGPLLAADSSSILSTGAAVSWLTAAVTSAGTEMLRRRLNVTSTVERSGSIAIALTLPTVTPR